MKTTFTILHWKMLTLALAWLSGATPHAADLSSLPNVRVRGTDPTALEGSSTGAFTITRNGTSTTALTVHYALSGSASNGLDYASLPGSVTIPANHLSADVVVTPVPNAMIAEDKMVVLTLSSSENYHISERASARVRIVEDRFDDLPPTISITSPTNGSRFLAPATITIQADASDSDGAVAKVSFYANDEFLGDDTTPPFSLVWANVRAGRYALFARATDTNGLSALSDAVSVLITNVSPSIALISPTNGTTVAAQSSITIEARVATMNGLPVKVQFFADSRFLGIVTNSPFQFVWPRIPAGRHVVAAKAIDSEGMTATAYATLVATNKSSITAPHPFPEREQRDR